MLLAKMPVLSLIEHARLDTMRYTGAAALYALSSLVFGRKSWISMIVWGISLTAMWLASNQFVRFWARQQKRLLIGDKEWNAARTAASHTWTVCLARGFLWGFAVVGIGARGAEAGSSFWIGSLISGVICAVVWVVISKIEARLK